MTQEVYVLKLKSGEELIARIDTEYMKTTIVLDQPMGIQVMMQQGGKPGFAMIPWMMACDDKKFTIDINEVLKKGKARNEMEKQYLSAVTGLSL